MFRIPDFYEMPEMTYEEAKAVFGAMKVLKKRAEFYGATTEQLAQWIDNGLDESSNVLQAHRIVKAQLEHKALV